MSKSHKLKFPVSFWDRARAGDDEALRKLFEYNKGVAWWAVKGYILARWWKLKYWEADDLVQETLLKFWLALRGAVEECILFRIVKKPRCARSLFDPEYDDGDALPYVIETAKNTVKDYYRKKFALKRPQVVSYYDTVNEASLEYEEPIDSKLAPYEDYASQFQGERTEDRVAAYYELEPEPYEDFATEDEYLRWIAEEEDGRAEEDKVSYLIRNKMGALLYEVSYYNVSERKFVKIYGETRRPDYVGKTDKPTHSILFHDSNDYAKRLFWTACGTHERLGADIEADTKLGVRIEFYLNLINRLMRYCDVNGNGKISPYREGLEDTRLDDRGLFVQRNRTKVKLERRGRKGTSPQDQKKMSPFANDFLIT